MVDIVLRELLKKHEGYVLKPYICPSGFKTIGCGHNIDANPLHDHMASYLAEYGELTGEMVEELLSADVENALMDCRHLFPHFDTFSQVRQRALIDWMFNLGIGTARKFKKAVSAINRGDWHTAAIELQDSDWYVQVGSRGTEIVKMVEEG